MQSPKISIVTAAYNMEDYVGDTIQSVVPQKRDGDQYIFIDGASNDRTVQIARSFGDGVDVLVSEPDAGQYHAIQKGFSHATGDVLGWINADDILMPWTLSVVREIFEKFPQVDWITGSPSFLAENGQLTRVHSKLPVYPRRFIANGWYQRDLGAYLQQESMFWRKSLWDNVGGLDCSISLAADFELWTRFAQYSDLIPVDVPLAAFRERPGQQRSSLDEDSYSKEVAAVCDTKLAPSRAWKLAADQGIVCRSLARLAISARGGAIVYDRRSRGWKMVTRRRSISRTPISALVDEWKMKKSDWFDNV